MPPSWDSDGNLWAARTNGTRSDVYVITPDGRTIAVAAESLANRNVQGFRIARDGSRVAFAIESEGSSRLFIARVVRFGLDMDPKIRIEAPVEIPWTAGSIKLINWMDATDLAILTSSAPRSIWKVSLDASEEINLAGIVNPVVIAAAPGMPLLAINNQGTLSVLNGQTWMEIGVGRYPIYPG
ncbi:lipoprotein LpqB [mine drainage metagenome]|uniref:Lipoprotein LpqB n=1 Tax=mine drainage metagenome TaxID=410659 RepID=A0A1J5PRG2_9ZZZZ